MDAVRIVFRKRANKEAAELSRDAAILVQAIKALGRDAIDERVVEKLIAFIPSTSRSKIIRECRYVTGWVLDVLKQAADHSSSKGLPL